MTKLFKLVLIASAIVALTTGCKDNNGGDPIKKMIPSEIKYIYSNNNYSYSFTYCYSYDNRNRIIRIEEFYDNGTSYIQDFNYDAKGRLVGISVDGDYGFTFSYVDNYVFIYLCGEEFAKFEVKNDRLIKVYELDEGEEELILTVSYDSRGNVTRIVNDYRGEMFVNYENKRGIYSGINMPSWFLVIDFATEGDLWFHTVNNPLTIKDVYENRTYLTTYLYEDYDNDYPTKIIVKEDEILSKQSKVFSFFNRKEKPTRSISSDEYSSHYEIKYIEAK